MNDNDMKYAYKMAREKRFIEALRTPPIEKQVKQSTFTKFILLLMKLWKLRRIYRRQAKN